jgi:glutathione S-transferase
MKLYYAPGACSFASHIVLHELALAHDTERVNLRTRTTAAGDDYTLINPKGYVPALMIEPGIVLTEGTAILQYLADLRPDTELAAAAGSLGRYRLAEWLGYINSEIHKNYSPLFNPLATDDMKASARAVLVRRYAYAEEALSRHPFLLGVAFSVADAYLYTTLTWSKRLGVDLADMPHLLDYQRRVSQRPSVTAAAAVESAQN